MDLDDVSVLINVLHEGSSSSRRNTIRGFWSKLDLQVRTLTKGPSRNLGTREAIQQSKAVLISFAKASQEIAASKPEDVQNFYQGFVSLAPSSSIWSDIQNFICHELFTIFITHLVLEKRWSLLGDLLSEPLGYETGAHHAPVNFTRLSKGMPSLDLNKERLAPRYEIIAQLHSKGELGELAILEDLQAADFLLYLRAPYNGSSYSGWRPWSCAFLRQAPTFIARARSLKNAEAILPAIGVSTVVELRTLVSQRLESLLALFEDCFEDVLPTHIFDASIIGTTA